MPVWLIAIVVSFALQFIAAALAPKAKPQKPADLQPPTASAGASIPKVFGTITITGTNTLWYGDIRVSTRKG